MTETIHTLDARGLNCPLPILRTKKAMAGLTPGAVIEITSTDPGSLKDLGAFCNQTGHQLLSSSEKNGEFVIQIRKA